VGVVLPQPIQFGKYTLFERIGRGGMADVFKARVQGPAGFERVFVVKRILPHLSDDPQFNKMFVEEAKMSARLNHPNIVQVFELGAVDGEYFISMEYVRGRDLAETMRTLWARVGPPRPELVAYVGREMCRALAYAHDLTGDDGKPIGMIHRDVSPSNVMLSYEGAVKILDFGIAKALGGDQKDEGTQRGTLKGKFAYMAPEQTQGNDVDRRIDIFATGIVLHEILTGRRLFKGENDLQTVEKVRQCDVPPPSLQNPLCPPELDAIVLKALAKSRDDRFQTANDMADALDDIVHMTRFQPTHLAQLMRDLFPGEAGGPDNRNATGSVRVSQTMTGSSSRPYSQPVRSPTIPPVSVSRSSSVPQLADPALTGSAPQPRPFWQKPGFLVTLVLVGVGAAFTGGIVFRESVEQPNAGGAASAKPKEGTVTFRIDSMPPGAKAFDANDNRLLCAETPCNVKVSTKSGAPIVVLVKKDGYEDERKEAGMSGLPVFARLRPVLRAPRPKPEEPKPEVKPVEPKLDGKPAAAAPTTPTDTKPVPAVPAPPTPPTPAPSAPALTQPSRSSSRGEGTRGSSRRRSGTPKPPGTDLVDPF
jgi:serine/threonine protein kinase